ncbi:MAG TPA: hypothetical protein VKA64_11130 [Gammaproteobacteria bacterium]|nr:hypothetical protein [Gammaproteobacteria bacterium]
MPTAENALLEIESGQSQTSMTALSNSGDNKTFSASASLFSGRAGFDVDVRPNGIRTGGEISPASSGTADAVDVAAATAYQDGADVSIAGTTDLTVNRPSTDPYMKASIVVDGSGSYAVVQGTEGTGFSDVRGNAGGPPFIPDGQIEVGQIWYSATASGVVADDEIYQVVGSHQERYDSPLWEVDYFNGEVSFLSALPKIHGSSGSEETKNVYASYATPIFSQVQLASDFVPPENSHSVGSTQLYGTTLGSISKSLNQGSFTAYLQDGVTDPVIKLRDETLWFRFKPDRHKGAKILAQGKLGVSRTFPAGDNMSASCTISSQSEANEVEA